MNDRFADKEWLKKFTKPKAASFNTLRAKVRKGIEEYREKIEEYRLNPSAFVDADEAESVFGSDDSFDETSSESESESESDNESVEKVWYYKVMVCLSSYVPKCGL